MRPAQTVGAAAFAVALLLAGCGSTPVAQSSPTPVAGTSASPGATPSAAGQCQNYQSLPGLCVGVIGRFPTHDEYVAMSAIGAPAIEKALGYKDWSACSNGENCYRVSPEPSGMVGTDAGVLNGGFGQYPGGGLGAACWVFLFRDSAGWHFLNFACAQNPGFIPGSSDTGTHVFVNGCANYRTTPSTTATVVGCLAKGTVVNVDSAPVYAEAHVWWQLTGRGWMAHDYLCEICRV
jgi:hypothetical protein